MKNIIDIIVVILLSATAALGQTTNNLFPNLQRTGWTTTTNAATARSALSVPSKAEMTNAVTSLAATYTFTQTNLAAGTLVTNGANVFVGTNTAHLSPATNGAIINPTIKSTGGETILTFNENGIASLRTAGTTVTPTHLLGRDAGGEIYQVPPETYATPETASNTAAGLVLAGDAAVSNALTRDISLNTKYGARGDGQDIYGYTISSGTVTVPGGQFTAADVNDIFLGYQDSTNLSYFLATITNVISATQVMLNTNLTIAETNEGIYGYNNVAAFTNAVASEAGDVVFFATNGIYLLDGLTASASGGYTIVQLPSPTPNTSTNPWRTILFRGSTPAVGYPQTATNGSLTIGYQPAGTILFPVSKKIGAVTNSFIESHGGSGIYGGFAWGSFRFENLTFRHPPDPQLTTFQFKRGGFRSTKNCSIDCDIPPNYLNIYGEPVFYPADFFTNASTCVAAIIGPDTYNYLGSVDENLSVQYQGLGMRVGEHSVAMGNFLFVGCGSGIYLDTMAGGYNGANSGLSAQKLNIFSTKHPILVSTNGSRQIMQVGMLHLENHSVNIGAQIKDSADVLTGVINVVTGTETATIQSTKLNWFDAVNNVWHQSANSFSGANITDATINSNKLDTATKALLGGGSWSGTLASAGNSNTFSVGTFGAGYPYGTLRIGDATSTKPGYQVSPYDNTGRSIYWLLSSKADMSDAAERHLNLTVEHANKRVLVTTGSKGDSVNDPLQMFFRPAVLNSGLESYTSLILDTNGQNRAYGTLILGTNITAGGTRPDGGNSGGTTPGIALIVTNGSAVFRGGIIGDLDATQLINTVPNAATIADTNNVTATGLYCLHITAGGATKYFTNLAGSLTGVTITNLSAHGVMDATNLTEIKSSANISIDGAAVILQRNNVTGLQLAASGVGSYQDFIFLDANKGVGTPANPPKFVTVGSGGITNGGPLEMSGLTNQVLAVATNYVSSYVLKIGSFGGTNFFLPLVITNAP